MRHYLLFSLGLLSLPALAEHVELSTPHNSLVLNLEQGHEPQFVYYGSKLAASDLATIRWQGNDNGSRSNLYPAYGANQIQNETCLSMRHADGNLSTQLLISDYQLTQVNDKAPNGADRSGQLLTITLKDPLYPTTVHLYYQSYSDVDMIESWTDIENGEKKTVTLTQFYNPILPIRRGDVWATHFMGSWASEAQLVEEPLTGGTLIIQDKDGIRNAMSARNEVMFSLDGKPQEGHGATIGTSLLFSGNYRVSIDTDNTDHHYYMSGINPDNSEYHLKKGEVFTTPRTAYTYSENGTNGASQNFHAWARKYQLRHGDQQRMILLNSWEGVYFDIKEPEMAQMMRDIKEMGGELFVMDDGWFGDKYPRTIDTSSLGDWVTDTRKLPNGIGGLVETARNTGVKFGIWIEPEMANTVSELYEAHPDWILKAPGREPVKGRGGTQVVLDLANPKVQDFVFSIVDKLMTQYPGIAYIKWDANAPVMNHGSQYLSKEDQSHMEIEYHRGLMAVCQRIRDKYPDLIIQACASGGGRASYGVLPYFDEFWVSDNTDALQRIRMQWGTSYFYPAIAMASHISAVPNHTIRRTTSIKLRCDVAMSGRLGMELQPKNMTDIEKQVSKQAIADYKKVRPTIQFGDLYRLHSPYAGDDLASLMYVNSTKSEAVFFWYKLETFKNQHLPIVKMQGLDPNKRYTVTELNRIDLKPLYCEGKSYTGAYLMQHGLEMPYSHQVEHNQQNDWSSRVLRLVAE